MTFITAPLAAGGLGPLAEDRSPTGAQDYAEVLGDVSRLLEQPPNERLANLERFARCLTVRFRRRRMSQEERDLQLLMPASLARSSEVWEYTSCSICLADFADGEELRRAPCPGGHAFHPKCLRKWLDRSHATCPVCRANVGEEGSQRAKGGASLSAEALADYIMRRMRSGKVDFTISEANHQRAEQVMRQMREPAPPLREVSESEDEEEDPKVAPPPPVSAPLAPTPDLRIGAIFAASIFARQAERLPEVPRERRPVSLPRRR